MPKDDENSNGRIARRTLLKASGASIVSGVASKSAVGSPAESDLTNNSNPSATAPEDHNKPSNQNEPPREPDIKVVDNSESEEPINIKYRKIKGENIDIQGNSDKSMGETQVNTTGLNHETNKNQIQNIEDSLLQKSDTDIQNKVNNLISESRKTIERIPNSVNDFGQHLSYWWKKELIEVEVQHQGESDKTKILVGRTGAQKTESVLVDVDKDGSISASTEVTCRE